MNLFKSIKNNIKKVLSGTFVLAMLAQFVLPVSAQASGAVFNFMDNDSKTLRGANRTLGETDWQSSVEGQVGDEFRAIVYVHNGMVDTTAHNTRISIDLPEQTDGNLTVGATISADDAASVSDTLDISLDGAGDVQFIPGTVAWYPVINGKADTQVDFPFGQTGDEILSDSGVNIGNVNGCWQYVSYISFGFRVVPQGEFNLKIDKLVRNVSLNETNYIDYNQARAGDTLEYKIIFKNIGDGVAEAALLTDAIPANTSYIPDTTRISFNGDAESNPGNTLGTSGLELGDLNPGEWGTVRFRVKTSESLANNEILTNTAYLSSCKITVSDAAKTIIVSVVKPNPPVGPGLPVTGAGTIIVSMLGSLMAAFAILFYRRKKLACTEEARIVNDLIG